MKNKKIKEILINEYQGSEERVKRHVHDKNYTAAFFWETRQELIEELYAELFDKHIENIIKKESE